MQKSDYTVSSVLCILCGALFLILVSCSKTEEVFEAAPFTVDEELLAAAIEVPELGLTISPPDGWTMLDSVQLDNFRRMLGGTELSRIFYPVFPLVVLSDSATGSLLYIAQIEESDAAVSTIAERYTDFVEKRSESAAMTKTHYLINGMKIYYYMLHSAQTVNYKLVGEAAIGKRFLIEYIIGLPTYAAMEPAVSSSLATLESTTPSGNP